MRGFLPVAVLTLLSLTGARVTAAPAAEISRIEIGRGTSHATTAFLRRGSGTGPTVMIVAGMRGDEPAGARAAGQLRHRRITRGRLVVLPRANVLGLAWKKRLVPAESPFDLNRQFPSSKSSRPQAVLARRIWSLGILDAKVLDTRHRARGKGNVRIAFSRAGRRLFAWSGGEAGIRYAQGPLLAPGGDPAIPDFESLAVYRTEIARNGAPKGVMIGTPAMVRGSFGKGRVLAMSPPPEQAKGLHGLVRSAVLWLGRARDR